MPGPAPRYTARQSRTKASLDSGLASYHPKRANLAFSPRGIRRSIELPVNFFAEVFPDLVRHIEKHFDDFGIELPPGPFLDFGPRGLQRLRRAIRTIGCNG